MKKKLFTGLLISFLVISSNVCIAGLIGVSEIKVTSAYTGGNAWLQVSEVVATESGTGDDLALAADGATVSSSGDTGYTLSSELYTIDGFGPSSYYTIPGIFHSGTHDVSTFLSVHLATPSELDSITLYGRTDSGVSYRDIYTIELFDVSGASLFTATNLNATGSNHLVSIALPDTAPIPEPATMLLFGTGLVGLVGSRLRKKRKKFIS